MSSVSFVVPVFNKTSYLKYVVNSISSQKGDFDKEYIFIDDGSTDDSLKILKKEYPPGYPFFIVNKEFRI